MLSPLSRHLQTLHRLLGALSGAMRGVLSRILGSVGQFEPDFWRNLGRELQIGRHWLDRSIVLAFAVLTGAVVVLFTLLAEAGFGAFESLRASGWWAPG